MAENDAFEATSSVATLVCLDCGGSVNVGEVCHAHPDEPLFDPYAPDIQVEMEQLDTREKHRVFATWSGAGAAVGLCYGIPIAAIFVDPADAGLRLFLFVAIVLALPSLAVGNYLGRRRFTPRFSRWLKGWPSQADENDVAAVNAGKGTPTWL